MPSVFVAGGTGYIGRALISRLLDRGHTVTALTRAGSEKKLPAGARCLIGDALDARTFDCDGADTFVHLVGTPHPAPWKGAEFRAIDLESLKASVAVAQRGDIKHFVYLSVAQPAPVMRAYIEVRAECERIIANANLTATVLRPWYVLGEGHRWPMALIPIYLIAEGIPGLREGARRLGLVTLRQMVNTLTWAVENPPAWTRLLGVPEIRKRRR